MTTDQFEKGLPQGHKIGKAFFIVPDTNNPVACLGFAPNGLFQGEFVRVISLSAQTLKVAWEQMREDEKFRVRVRIKEIQVIIRSNNGLVWCLDDMDNQALIAIGEDAIKLRGQPERLFTPKLVADYVQQHGPTQWSSIVPNQQIPSDYTPF